MLLSWDMFIEADQIVWTTFYTIDRLLEYKNWPDALALYFRYIKQSRIQETNQSWSLDSFMMKWLKRGDLRFKNAKRVLRELGLIEVIQVRGVDGKVKTFYVKTNFIINEQKLKQYTIQYEIPASSSAKNQSVDFPPDGEWGTNALSTKDKCLKNIKETTSKKKPWRIDTLEEFIEKWENTISRYEKEGYLRKDILRACETCRDYFSCKGQDIFIPTTKIDNRVKNEITWGRIKKPSKTKEIELD